MNPSQIFVALIISLSSLFVQAQDLAYIRGIKYPNTPSEGVEPVTSVALTPRHWKDLKGFNILLPFVTPSPDQEDANSCMIMSLTGVVEWWLHRLSGVGQFTPNGNLDLSERWWMNLQNIDKYTQHAHYWHTDAIYMFNAAPAALSRNYHFAKGWYIETEDDIVPARAGAPGAKYGARYNWIDQDLARVPGPFVQLPKFGRKVIFKNRDENPWAIGTAPNDIVERIKKAFQDYKAPIQVIYNHEGYWHSVYIIGYDENMSSYGCRFTYDTLVFFETEANKSAAAGNHKRAKKLLRYKKELTESFERVGGCNPKGMFFVRDSQYPDPREPMYIYDPKNPYANKPYSSRIVLREFDWIRTMANHVSVIYPTAPPGGSR